MPLFALFGLSLALGYGVFRYGGDQPEDWVVSMTVVGVVSAVYWAITRSRDAAPPIPRWVLLLLWALPAFAFLQWLPLPFAVVRLLSPTRAAIAASLAPLAGPAAWVPLSNAPVATLFGCLRLAACVLVALLVRDILWRTRARLWTAAVPLLVIAGLEAVLGLVQSWSQDDGVALARGTYHNRDHFAFLLELALPFALAWVVSIYRGSRRRESSPAFPALAACGLLALAAAMFLAIVASLSRIGFLASLGSFLVMGLMALSGRESHLRRVLLAAAVALLVVLGFVFVPAGQLIARFADLASTDAVSAGTRAQVWRDTTRMVAAYPVTGAGLGAYESTFPRYQDVAPTQTVHFAHNDYLQALAELGIPACLMVLVLLVWLLRSALRACASPDPPVRCFAVGALGALFAAALHALVDFNSYIPANAMLMAWIAGMVMVPWPHSGPVEVWMPRISSLRAGAPSRAARQAIDLLP